jgi:gas vesicle protein
LLLNTPAEATPAWATEIMNHFDTQFKKLKVYLEAMKTQIDDLTDTMKKQKDELTDTKKKQKDELTDTMKKQRDEPR